MPFLEARFLASAAAAAAADEEVFFTPAAFFFAARRLRAYTFGCLEVTPEKSCIDYLKQDRDVDQQRRKMHNDLHTSAGSSTVLGSSVFLSDTVCAESAVPLVASGTASDAGALPDASPAAAAAAAAAAAFCRAFFAAFAEFAAD